MMRSRRAGSRDGVPVAAFALLALLVPCTGRGQTMRTPDAAALRKMARESLAPLEGTLRVPGLQAPVEVLRDRWGIPHVYAANQHDLFLAQGFVVAQDRLFQMDLWRRTAVGEMAEIVGESALEGDRFARLVKYRGDLDTEWSSYAPDAREIATAFVQGINAWIDACGTERLPVEYRLLGFAPKKWAPEDVLGRMSGVIMVRNLRLEPERAALVHAVGVEAAARLAPTDPPVVPRPVEGLDLSGLGPEILKGYKAATKRAKFDPVADGSNNWALDGTRTASGKPYLVSDPHRAIEHPSLRYLVHLHAPGWNVIGAGEPALPGVAIGHNERIAWGFTIVGTDQADLYVEELSPDGRSYRVGDSWRPLETVVEHVRVKGKPEPVPVELQFTRHGPVLHVDRARRTAVALRWAGAEPGGAAYLASLSIDRARDWKEFEAAVARWKTPSENMLYADVDGHIGWIAAALTPVRRGWNGLLPVPGADGRFEWQGFRRLDELPRRFDPPEHWIATANHNIVPKDYPHEIGYEFSQPYRQRRIEEVLSADRKWSLADMQALQLDDVSLPGRSLAKLAAVVARQGDAALRPHAETLAAWDGLLARDSTAASLYAVWLDVLATEFAAERVPVAQREYISSKSHVPRLLDALERPTEAWFGADPTAARDRFLVRTFATAVAKVRKRLGDDPAQWRYGRLHQARFEHVLSTRGPAYAEAFDPGSVPRSGDGFTPHATTSDADFRQTSGASYRHVFDLADWDRGLATSVPGQSSQPESPHYADLLPLWAEGKYFPLAFSRKKVEEVTRHRLKLVPQ